MANTKRRQEYTDRNGNMFMPMNVEGGTWNENFITTPKVFTIVGIIVSLVLLIVYLNEGGYKPFAYILFISIWFVISTTLLRFVVFEETFYYKMYKELSQHEISSPALFWNIASIKDTDEGAILTYADGKIGVIVKAERDTITGKNKDFKEIHYDAISDFYKELATNRFCFVQMNIMEQAGKDPRLNELSKIVNKSDNANIRKLMEMQVGHIKNITHKSLYESDYFLIYTNDMTRIDNLIGDVTECIFKLLDGAFIGYNILLSRDVVDLVKELEGVNYFNSTDASLQMFNRNAAGNVIPFNIKGILWDDDVDQELNNIEISKLRNTTNGVLAEKIKQKDVALKSMLYRIEEPPQIGIDLDSINEMQQEQIVKQQKMQQDSAATSMVGSVRNRLQKKTNNQQSGINLNKSNQINDQQINNQNLPNNNVNASIFGSDDDDEIIDL